MKRVSERNPYVVGAVGIGVVMVAAAVSQNYTILPMFNRGQEYSAHFAEAGGLESGSFVEMSGVRVGKVSSVELDGPRVLVKFRAADIHLGDRSEAAIKLAGVLGTRYLQLTPRGNGEQTGPIPLERTTPPYELPDAIGDLTTTISGLDTGQLSDSLAALADTFSDTRPQLKVAIEGVARVSDTLDKRDEQLRNLLGNANKVTTVLAERSDEIVRLVTNTNALLVQLRSQSGALDHISNDLANLADQLKAFIADNREALQPALEKLNGVLEIVDNRKEAVQQAIAGLNRYALGLGEAVASGPFFKAYLVNLLPGQFVQPFIDAAFSDLGMDPNVLLPTERSDPQTGQPGTPPLPVPFPRTGQGGDPNLNLPDAITGNPGDPRYPYREPLPAPPPGGPPPGPPAPANESAAGLPEPAESGMP